MAEAMVLAVYMPPQEPGPGWRRLDRLQFGVVDLVGVLARRPRRRRRCRRFSPVVHAGQDGAAVDEDAGAVEARHGHDAAGHVLVAAADGDEAVEALAADDGLDGVGDDLAGDERVLHALGAHADAVGDGDGVEDDGLAAGGVDALRASRRACRCACCRA
jgi:hypothetical protein